MEWHPVAERFPLLTGSEWTAFKESIRKTKGPEQKITYRIIDGRRQGLDGRNRHKACVELGIEPPMERRLFDDEGDVKDFIIRRNVYRRHLTPELRRQLVEELRAEGRSTRQIAGTLGVSQSTVVNDLTAGEQFCSPGDADSPSPSGEQNCSPGSLINTAKEEEKPKTVTGADGKTYPAAKAHASMHSKSGRPVFDDRRVKDAFGVLVRLLGDRMHAFGNHDEHDNCLKALDMALAAYTRWQKATT